VALKAVHYEKSPVRKMPVYERKSPAKKELVGVDLFIHWNGKNPDELAEKIQKISTEKTILSMITNRGIKVWPEGFPETFCTDHWRCRFKPMEGVTMTKQEIIHLLTNAEDVQMDIIKTENLYSFDGVAAYSLGQGQ